MLLVIYGNEDRNEHEFYNSRSEYIKDSFTKQFETAEVLEFSLSLKDWQILTVRPGEPLTEYEKKKIRLRGIAQEFQYLVGWYGLDLYFSEWAAVGEWFTTQGKRYGLIHEFEENGII